MFTNREITDLPPFYDTVETNALEVIVDSADASEIRLTLTFEYAGCEVTVYGDGTVRVTEVSVALKESNCWKRVGQIHRRQGSKRRFETLRVTTTIKYLPPVTVYLSVYGIQGLAGGRRGHSRL